LRDSCGIIFDMESTPNLAEMNAEALREFAAGLLGQLAQKDETIKIKQLKIDQLTHEMGILKRWRYGRRSEQLESGQRSLLEESIDEDLEALGVELEALQEPAAPRQHNDKPRRTALPGHLPRREVRHEPEQTQCSCGCTLERIGEDVSEKLDYTPGVFQVERHIRGKWVCRRCERLIQAPVPAQVIDKGIPTAALLAQVLVAKFAECRYRHSQYHAASGTMLTVLQRALIYAGTQMLHAA
jgi:transposase